MHLQVQHGIAACSPYAVSSCCFLMGHRACRLTSFLSPFNKRYNLLMSTSSQHPFHLLKTPPLRTSALSLSSNTNIPETNTQTIAFIYSRNHGISHLAPQHNHFKNPLPDHSSEYLYCHFFHLKLN